MKKNYALIFKCLSDNNRLKIIDLIKNEKQINACNILKEFDITQPTLSYHMDLLVKAGLVMCAKDKNCSIYKINETTMKDLRDFFELRGRL